MPAQAPDEIDIRWAEPGDRAAIAGLLLQTKHHYGEEPAAPDEIKAAVAGWLGQKPGHALFVIAHTVDGPAGWAPGRKPAGIHTTFSTIAVTGASTASIGF